MFEARNLQPLYIQILLDHLIVLPYATNWNSQSKTPHHIWRNIEVIATSDPEGLEMCVIHEFHTELTWKIDWNSSIGAILGVHVQRVEDTRKLLQLRECLAIREFVSSSWLSWSLHGS